MELELFHRLVLAGAIGAAAGMAAWLFARAAIVAWLPLAKRRVVNLALPASPGDRIRRKYRDYGRELAVWLSGLLVMLSVAVVVWLLAPQSVEWSLPLLAWIGMLVLVVGDLVFVGWVLYRIIRRRSELRHGWAMRRAVAGILERMCMNGYRIFHDVRVEDSVIDHVVLGEKGVFCITTVARRIPRKLESPTVRLKAGKLGFSDGFVAGIPVGDAARKLSLLSGELTRLVGHKVQVKSILAAPGWHSQPDADANHLLLNENNLVTMASWNSADAFLMHEDLPGLEKWLTDASTVKALD
jgi:hypothetical protein